MRIAYGQALAAYGAQHDEIIVLDADISASSQTHYFAAEVPERFYDLGITEAGMVDVGVGLALAGKVPFVNTFAFLLSLRAAEQVRTCVAYAETNVKLVGSYGGLSDAFDGPTHHAVTDLAVMRAMPNLAVLVAADATEAAQMVPLVAEHDGPVYLRVSRAEVPVLFDADTHPLEVGKGIALREGDDVTLVGTGVMVARCLDAADQLADEGISAGVIEIHTLKPLDVDLLCDAAQQTGAVVTAEEHSIVGGLGSAVAEALSDRCAVPVKRVGVADRFCETGPYEALLDRYGMGVADVVSAARAAVKAKR
jgi:transketolase